ncbi:bifunctional UDP-N-acetylmuramoyl-tripeptide:D-alanyl-D-alanine ligase/alanine racemase [Carboxylicivirga sp. A043]|uniref:bifunctional UDP-N-acetylmuramoyl-tripeptide:D-alanyl-D-alanine ligase/alanine racemase n=1 Tax=Carboxylicivirga litoralis TaxID=2816963 RepID=UPI0021CB0751|nr:bifunctional UDP-N-acetylmuramoyl-tripeptide:D-alanyl-D-alanine ligase/alanine racemase [Carboxylicivirga sp. A043]MCU4155672.1 bifunctional UDP-N-acetylmuramoyl-tripeptide:D-alanyl-D-alanine ligase/alanine racemase [Carboxylicivirga sp. A043]
MAYSVAQLAQWSAAKLIGDAERTVEKIIFDSRKSFSSEETLFVAIKSTTNDGHSFIAELYDKGMRSFIVEADCAIDYKKYPEASFIECTNSIESLQSIAAQIRHSFSIPFIGITGSNGKTIIKEWLAHILEKTYKVGRSPRSFNSQIGVPLSIWFLAKDIDFALIEAGISMPGEMEKISTCIQPAYGLLTNIGQAHQENFESLEQKLDEKLKLFASAHTIFYNGDDAMINEALKQHFPDKALVSVGAEPGNNLQIVKTETTSGGTSLSLHWKEQAFTLQLPFQDAISIENSLLVALCALNLGVSIEILQTEMQQLFPIAMRLEQKEGINNCLLIDDGYNADITSLGLALDFLNQMGAKRGLSKTLILSDIQQSGVDATLLYQKVLRLAEEKGITKLIGIGENMFAAKEGLNAYQSTEEFLEKVDVNTFKDEAILLKGARHYTFERISALLEQRRHKTVLEINLNALAENVKYFRSKLGKETKLLAMVKAFSYGTGSFEIANLLAHQKVDYLGVAFADEGIELRKTGISLPIIVMNPELSSFPMMLEYELEPEIYSFEVLEAYLSAVQRQGLSRVPIHVKVDTGMNRLGFLPEETESLIERLHKNSSVFVSSVFSHLAGSDEAIHDGFTQQQINCFTSTCQQMEKGLGYGFTRHILNSAGIERFPEAQMDMVRLGIGMYGVSVVDNTNLQQVNTLKSYVSQFKTIKAGETVGYSRKGRSNNEMQIAVVPIGYADGYNRRLSNGVGHVIINGKKASVVGNICMDMCMIDVTDLNIKAGDEVEIFGTQLPIKAMAQQLETIPYEILTSISRRVKRIYIME